MFFFSLKAQRERERGEKKRSELIRFPTFFSLHHTHAQKSQSERTLARLLDRRTGSTAALAASLPTEKLPGALSPLHKKRRQQHHFWGGVGVGGQQQQQQEASAAATAPAAPLPSDSDLAAMALLERDRRKAACVSAARCLALFDLQRAEMESARGAAGFPSHLPAPALPAPAARLPPQPPPLLLALADRVETALTPLLASMEHRGVLVDVAALSGERAFLRKVQAAAVARLQGLAGERASRLAVQAAAGARALSSRALSASATATASSPALRRLADAARDRARAHVGALNLEAPVDVSQLLFDWLGLSSPGAAAAAASPSSAGGAGRGGGGGGGGGGGPAAAPRQPTNARALAPLAARGEPGVLLVQAWRGARKREEDVQLLLRRCAVTAAVAERERQRRRRRRERAAQESSRSGGLGGGGGGGGGDRSPLLLCRLPLCLRQTAAAGGRLIVDSPSLQTLAKAIDYCFAFGGGGEDGGGEAAAATTSTWTSTSTSSCVSNVRNAVVPPRGGLLVSADYAQMELRLAAHLSNDAALLACFGGGGEGEGGGGAAAEDPMRVVAAAVFFRRPDEIQEQEQEQEHERQQQQQQQQKNASTPSLSSSSLPATPEAIRAVTLQQRDAAKRLVYGLMYGMGDAALADALGAGS